MLSKLNIENYALIEKASIDFPDGFIVITGETGSGKSIMLDALSLLLGVRADSKTVADKSKKTIVEAVFSSPPKELETICRDNAIDWDNNEIIIRREISTSGKSRSFVNDTPVNLSVLSEISRNLVDIHSQHANIALTDGERQLKMLDAFVDNSQLLLDYQEVFKKYISLRNRLRQIRESTKERQENKEYILFRLEQLEKLKPRKGELEALEKELEILSDADRIKSDLADASRLMEGNAGGALKSLNSAASILHGIDFSLFGHDEDADLAQRLDSVKIELRDISDTIAGYLEKIESNPERLEMIQSRVNNIYDALKRFKVKDEAELVDLYNSLRQELNCLMGDNSDIAEMDRELKILAKELKIKADRLSESRLSGALRFAEEIEVKARPLGLPNLRFEVELNKGKMNSYGQDNLSFKCSFNKNNILRPVSSIASGGEISRLMLAIKSLMADTMHLPTVIFDEIDTGVSGEIAHKMGKMMKEMSARMQVMAVTHLPQVAANGLSHLKVYKNDESEKTVSHIRLLDPQERIKEIAGMLSGMEINDAAMKNANFLLNS